MAKMTIMRGLPASGKSTKAEELIHLYGNTVRINKDLLRTMLHFDRFSRHNEENTRNGARKLADWFLSQDVNVIIDDTNLNERTVQSWKDLARIHNARIEYVDTTNVSVIDCIERDRNREKKVGKHVIQKMALQYLDYMKGEEVVVCDLDGTLCDITHRLHFAKGETKDWKAFFGFIPGDTLRTEVTDQVLKYEEEGCKIVFVSARPEDCRYATEVWLEKTFKGYKSDSVLIMREAGDKRDDTIVKSEIYDKYLKNLKIVKVFDDRPKVIRMWREKGLEVEDVGSGVEF